MQTLWKKIAQISKITKTSKILKFYIAKNLKLPKKISASFIE